MESTFHFRNAQLSDAKKLAILYKQVYIQTYGIYGVSDEFANFTTQQFSIERIEKTIQQNPDCILVAEYQNNLVGVAELEWNKQCPCGNIIAPELNKLYILEWFCGKGIGAKLMELAENTVKNAGEKQIWLWVLISNQRAISFYEKHEYQWIGNAPFQMEVNSYDNRVMLKILD